MQNRKLKLDNRREKKIKRIQEVQRWINGSSSKRKRKNTRNFPVVKDNRFHIEQDYAEVQQSEWKKIHIKV